MIKSLAVLASTKLVIRQLKEKRRELNELLQKEEIIWRQQSRIQWMKEGDCNTKFFHTRASTRRKKNRINRIQDDQGAVEVGF